MTVPFVIIMCAFLARWNSGVEGGAMGNQSETFMGVERGDAGAGG